MLINLLLHCVLICHWCPSILDKSASCTSFSPQIYKIYLNTKESSAIHCSSNPCWFPNFPFQPSYSFSFLFFSLRGRWCDIFLNEHSATENKMGWYKEYHLCWTRAFIPQIPSEISKGKTGPNQAWTGPESFRKMRFPDFKTIGTGRW